MNKPTQPRGSENLWKILDKLRGVDLRRPEELAEFLKKEDAQFSADDLIAFGYILSTRIHRSEGRFYVPEWLARAFAALAEGISPKTICDPWAGIGFLIAVLRETSKASKAVAITQNSGEHALGEVLVPQADWQLGDPLLVLGNVFDEQHEQDVVLILAGVHAATKFIAGGPKGRIEVGFLDGHGGSC